eukprot:scaffold2169_cov54-Isochrysis_galbana.AAC.1
MEFRFFGSGQDELPGSGEKKSEEGGVSQKSSESARFTASSSLAHRCRHACAGPSTRGPKKRSGLSWGWGSRVDEQGFGSCSTLKLTGAVMRGVVVPEDAELVALADRHLLYVRHQVVWDAFGILAYQARLMRSHRVEVAEQDD